MWLEEFDSGLSKLTLTRLDLLELCFDIDTFNCVATAVDVPYNDTIVPSLVTNNTYSGDDVINSTDYAEEAWFDALPPGDDADNIIESENEDQTLQAPPSTSTGQYEIWTIGLNIRRIPIHLSFRSG